MDGFKKKKKVHYFLQTGPILYTCKSIIMRSRIDSHYSLCSQKQVVDMVKAGKKAITLAIGDGANDVGMIKGN